MPKWFSCILYNISLRIDDGTTSLSPRNSSPSWLLISSRTGQYSLMLGAASGFLLGHPVCIVWNSFFSVGWFLVSSRNCCNFSLLTGRYSTVCRTFWCSVRQSFGDGARLRVSAIYKPLPGLYSTVRSYFCRFNNIRCNIGGGAVRGFLNRYSKGFLGVQ